jgi:CDP-diacylglycerol--glycerol-3-phosphate 3-phosphatidyltransferase
MLTLSRPIGCLVAGILYLADFGHMTIYGRSILLLPAIVATLALLTDMFDGKVARLLKLVTELGKWLDPVADKLAGLIVMIVLCFKLPVLIPFAGLIVWRDWNVQRMRHGVRERGADISAKSYGKATTLTLFVALVFLMVKPSGDWLEVALGLFAVAFGLKMYSWGCYRRLYGHRPVRSPS